MTKQESVFGDNKNESNFKHNLINFKILSRKEGFLLYIYSQKWLKRWICIKFYKLKLKKNQKVRIIIFVKNFIWLYRQSYWRPRGNIFNLIIPSNSFFSESKERKKSSFSTWFNFQRIVKCLRTLVSNVTSLLLFIKP